MTWLTVENELPTDPNFELFLMEQEAKFAPVAQEYMERMKRPKYPLPLYKMQCGKHDVKNRSMIDPREIEVELTDHEYRFLLLRALIYGTTYRFTHLRLEKPELARKILAQASASYPEELKDDNFSYQIYFTEIHDNAKEIYQLQAYFFPKSVNTPTIFI